jgi:hypothetical protein
VKKSTIATIITIILGFISSQLGGYLPGEFYGIAVGAFIVSLAFMLAQSVIELNKDNILRMFKYLIKNLKFTFPFIVAELFIAWIFIQPIAVSSWEGLLNQSILIILWLVSGLYRTVIEVTPAIMKLEVNQSINFYYTFGKTRLLYYFLLFIFFIRAELLLGHTIYQILPILIVSTPFFFFANYVPRAPTEINWFIPSLFSDKKLRLKITVLKFIYDNKSASLEDLKSHIKDEKLVEGVKSLAKDKFLLLKNNKFEFNPWVIMKQNIKFF